LLLAVLRAVSGLGVLHKAQVYRAFPEPAVELVGSAPVVFNFAIVREAQRVFRRHVFQDSRMVGHGFSPWHGYQVEVASETSVAREGVSVAMEYRGEARIHRGGVGWPEIWFELVFGFHR